MTPSRPRAARRGWLPAAVLAALATHAIALVFLRVPAGPEVVRPGALAVLPSATEAEPAADRRPIEEPGEPAGAAGGDALRAPAGAALDPAPIPAIRASPGAAEEATIPSTALTELRAAALPLVPTGTGIGRRRLERSPEELAIARAESLLLARMAGIAVAERRDIGAVGLANGGITVAVPWAGFLPANRRDGAWREERCEGGDGGDGDKAGEGEARRAQC